MPPPGRTRARPAVALKDLKSTVVPKEEPEIDETLAKLKVSKQPGETQPTILSETTRLGSPPLRPVLGLDADVKPLFTIPDLYPPITVRQDTKPKVETQDVSLSNKNAVVAPLGERMRPTFDIVPPSWKDVRKAKADSAHAARAKPYDKSNARNSAAADVDAKPDVRPRDLTDVDPSQSALRGAVEEMKNPDAEVKEELLLSDEFLLNALTWEGINHRYPIPLPNRIAEFGFSRAYISHLYGGNPQDVFPPPSQERIDWHGLNDWAFLSLEWNPHAPTRPGFSGLYFTMDRAATCDERQTLEQVKRTFVRLGPNRWIYLGQYKFTPGVSLTAALWTQQSTQVRRAWVRGVFRKGWGESVLRRVWFCRERGVDFEPKEEDEEDAKNRIKQIRATMTEEDVMGAYDRGEEEIGTFKMTCVGYDAEFLRVLQRNAPYFVPPPPKAKKPKQPKKGRKQKQEHKAPTRGTKRKARSTANDVKGRAEAKPESDEDGAHVKEYFQGASMTITRENAKRRKLA